MVRRAIIIILSVLSAVTLLAAGASYIYPIYESQTGWRLGAPDVGGRLWIGLDSGELRLQHSIEIPPPPRPFQHWGIGAFGLGRVDFQGARVNYRLRTLSVSVWLLLVAFSSYPLVVLVRGPLRRAYRRRYGRCPGCGYDLTGNMSGVCPECGCATKAWERGNA